MWELEDIDVRELRRLRDAVDEALQARLAEESAGEEKVAPASGSGGERRFGEGTLRREKVGCGKKACKKCADGPSHGPYWYLYYYRDGRFKSRYLGKNLPDEFEHLLDPKAERAPLRGKEEVPEGRDRKGLKPSPADPGLARFRQDELPLFRDA